MRKEKRGVKERLDNGQKNPWRHRKFQRKEDSGSIAVKRDSEEMLEGGL